MSNRRIETGRFGWVSLTIALIVCASTVTRIVVLAISDHGHAGPLTLARVFAVGLTYDVLVACWLAVPIVAYLVLVSRARYVKRGQRALRRVALGGLIAVTAFGMVAEVVFFGEFDGRFNFVAVDYLEFPSEVFTNIWQSYPLVWVLVGIACVTALVLWLLRGRLAELDARDGPDAGRRWAVAGVGAIVLLCATLTISPRLARVSDDRVLNEVASNGDYTFWQAFLGRDAPYEGLYAMRPDSEVNARLRRLVGAGTSPKAHDSTATRPYNVVVVLEESFGATLVGALHPRDTLSITPSFDSLANEGMLLTHAYSTGNRTIRAIEATTASIPPLPGISIVRRPQSENLFTLPAVLRANGYTTQFIYGGRALFDGMGSYVRNNGISRIIEQKDFPPGSYSTAWGVADEVIFDKTIAELDSLQATGIPFYTLVLTVSNHTPYMYPAGRIPQNPAEHRRTFAVHYADWALGRFMRMAQTHEFFGNTIFVLLGDHGARVYGSAEIPLPSYEVPILLYNKTLFPPGSRYTPVASSMDLPPTILGLLGIGGPTKFFGHDLFGSDSVAGRALMTHNSELALMRGDRIAVLGLRQSASVDALDAKGGLRRIAAPDSADRSMIEDAIAYFQGADALYRKGKLGFDSLSAPRR